MRIRLLTATISMLIAALAGHAATFTNLHNFSSLASFVLTNGDGASPRAGPIVSGGVVYGVTQNGGAQSEGTVFAIPLGTTNFVTLYNFTLKVGANTNLDGANPWGGLIANGSFLYGTTPNGGTGGEGTIFRVGTNGAGFQALFSFPALALDNDTDTTTNSVGGQPYGRLLLASNLFYGTALHGGLGGYGTVFSVNTNGTNLQVLHAFDLTDGEEPAAGVLISGTNVYGTTVSGGNLYGTLFCVSTNGADFTNTYVFSGLDGYQLYGDLVLSGSNLYSTTVNGGNHGAGEIFGINTGGGNFGLVYSFSTPVSGTNADGLNPYAGLILVGKNLYGVASAGGTNGFGTVFGVCTNGAGFTTLHNFTVPSGGAQTNSDGYSPYGLLAYSDGILYGTTEKGGLYGNGTVFGVTIFPTLNIKAAGNDVILSWNDPGFSLQSATNVSGVFSNVPAATSPYTNVIGASHVFFRLMEE